MATDDDVPADAPTTERIGLTGARFRARSPEAPRPPAAPGRFETALRGYSRREVDAHLARQDERIRALEEALRDSERRRAAVEAHAALLEEELGAAREGRARRPAEQSEQGSVADGLLRQARREAAQVRVEAARAARQVLDDAHAEAARTRERAERTAADWTTRVEQHLARRIAEVEAERLPGTPGT